MTRRETRRTRRVGWLAALLGAFVLALSVVPVTAWAAPAENSLAVAYVSKDGNDETADGTQDLPFASLKEAVLAVRDGGTVYVMNDLTISKMAYVDGKSVTVDGDGHVVKRSDEFEKSQDLNRGGFNAGMFEVANEGTLRLKDITLDDAMLHEGTEFVEEKTGQDVPNKNNEAKVQSGIITAFGDGHGHVILGEGTILKNYGGLCAVRVGGNRDADGNWSGSTLLMESGSKICDDSSSVAREGGFAAVWNQGGKVEMQPDSSIEHVNGRAIYSEDGGITTVGGSISDIVSNETMKGYTGSFSGDFGGMAYYGEASTGTFELTSTGSISDIKSHDSKAVDIAIMLVGSSFTMDEGSSITDISTVGLFNLNSGKAYINGRIENCHVGNVLFRLWGGGDVVFSLGETGEIKNCSTSDAAMLYRNGGRTAIEVNGEISNLDVGTVFWLSNNNSMKNGSFALGPTGRITACAGKAIRIDDPSAAVISGEISDCDGYAIQYGYTAGSSLKIESTSVISGNNDGGAQIYVEPNNNPLPATDELQHVAIERGALVGNQSVSLLRFGLVTLDADYSNAGLGIAHDDAVTAIKGAVSSEHSDWTFVSTSALWFQPSEESVHFTASKSSSVKNTGLFAAYVPLDGDGKPNGNVELVEVENGSVIDVNLNELTAGQSYALMFVNNKEYTLAPDDVTKYIGGGDGSETEGSCFPELTINGSVDLTYQENPETGEYGYDLESLTVGTDDYHATADQSLLDQLVSLLEVTYTYEDGTVATDDSKPGVYAITLGWKNGLTDGDVRVNGNNVKIGGTGTLIVRHTQDVEHAQDGTITYKLLEADPTDTVKNAVAKAKGSSPKFYTNNDTNRQADAVGIQLLDDDLLVYEGEDRRTPMEEKAAGYLGEPYAGRAYRYEFHYLDLVDAYNGNAWVSASGGTTVWLPYPEGVDSTTAVSLGLTVLHYKDLHREYGITGQDDVNKAISDCEMEKMEVTYDANGIRFDVDRSGFSPFAVVWQTEAHTITASAGNGGTIAPFGNVTVAEGADQTFAITPSQGYEIADVRVDGTSVGAVSTYTFENVADDHKIEATFRSTGGGPVTPPSTKYYEITSSAGEGGSISPSGTHEYAAGSDVSFSISPDEGYTVGSVTVDGVNVGQRTSYTFADLDADHTISVTFMPGSAPADPDDTGVSDWLQAGDHIAFLHGYGDGSGTFGPENDMTRAEVAQMFYNLLLDKSRGDVEVKFEDVPADAYYAEAVLTLASRGIVNGTSPETYEPNRPITRAEFVAIAMRFSNGEFEGENTFVDVPEDAWYRDYVVGATSFGWIVGYQDGSRRFGPEDTITRGQATMVTNRMLGRVADGAWIVAHLDELKTFVDLGQDHYAFFDVVEATNAHDYERADGSRYESWTGLVK